MRRPSHRELNSFFCCCLDTVTRLPAKKWSAIRPEFKWSLGSPGKEIPTVNQVPLLYGTLSRSRMIILFPQMKLFNPYRPNACWPSLICRHWLALVSHVCALPVNAPAIIHSFLFFSDNLENSHALGNPNAVPLPRQLATADHCIERRLVAASHHCQLIFVHLLPSLSIPPA